MRLNTKHKFILGFSTYFIVFFLIISILFIFIFRFIYIKQIKQEVNLEFSEIIKEHVDVDNQGFFFKKDVRGETLRSHLFADNISALFIATDSSVLRAYGSFEIQNNTDQAVILTLINKSSKAHTVLQQIIKWNDESFQSLIAPITYKGIPIAYMVVAKSQKSVEESTSSMVAIIFSLGLIGVVGSIIIGYFSTSSLLSPVHKLIDVIEKTNLHELAYSNTIKGSPNDEFVILSKKYNDMIIRLKNMSTRQKEFIANASHELKTPLTRAISSLDVLAAQIPSNSTDITQIKEDLLDINTLIERLLLLARIKEKGQIEGSVILKTLMNTIQSFFETQLSEKKISLTTQVEDNISLPLPKEYAAIVFQNIISNAIKYSHHNSTIDVHAYKKNGQIHVLIQDQGMGMNYSDKLKVFDRFFRSSKARLVSEGYGVGLSLVQEICEEYNAIVNVRSAEKKGTTVEILFQEISPINNNLASRHV